MNLLRHSPRPHSQVHLRPPAAPPVRGSHQQAAPGHWRGNERGGRERESVRADQPSRGESIREEKRRDEEEAKPARPARVRPLWSGAPPFAPPRFWLHLPSGSFPERGVPHSRQRHTARPPIGGEPPHPASVTLLGEKQAGKIHVPLGTPLVSFREARSVIVVVGGRGSEAVGSWLLAWRCGVDGVVVEMRLWRCWLFQNNDR